MAHPNIVELTDDNFDAEVIKSSTPTLVDFWAVWCGPCRRIAPTVEELATEYKGKLKVAKMDIDHHQLTPQRFGIRSVPTLLVFKDGKVVGHVIGADSRKLKEEVTKHL